MNPDDPLVDWLDAQLSGQSPWRDILDLHPAFGERDAYRLRTALVRRRCAGGDRLAGYKVAGSNLAVRKEEHVEGPIVGCVMASCVQDEQAEVAYTAARMAIEAEIAVLLKRDLQGPGLTLLDAWSAVEAVFPAFEVLAFRDGPRPSHQARILASNFNGRYVFGGPLRAPHGLDLRAEGVSVSVNGRPVASGTGTEVLGNPLAALALVANTMASYGEALRAGMIVMSGSLTPNVPVAPGDRVDAGFSRLGRIGVRFGARL
ncbi:fumarylacetoacetate hydrolase family protein [Pigmentiphaga soli]|uniref:Fumarylacetoacetate hydrolase family protein n=1 Tax=Pigmentiphaga soli TaxID=1007095 RepID=A0ABP8HA48_9BURK